MEISWRGLVFPLLALLNGGCATVIDGGGQVISINTVPSGADCALVRDGTWIGQVVSTPGSIAVDPGRDTIVVTCAKPGYGAVVGSDAAVPKGRNLRQPAARSDRHTRRDRRPVDPGGLRLWLEYHVTFPQPFPVARYEPPPGAPRY